MGQLKGSVLPDADAGRDALHHRLFGGADLRFCPGAVIVIVEADAAHDPVTDAAVLLGALHVDHGVPMLGENAACQIFVHGAVDLFDPFVHVAVLKIDLGQRDPQRGGRVAHRLFGLRPIRSLGGELVAGDHCPPLKILFGK